VHNEKGNCVFLLKHYSMGRSKHLDFEIVKKRARELRSIKKTVIELDGPIHEFNLEYDQFRNAEIVNLGLHILRIKNVELLDIKDVLKKIETYLNSIN
jgi:very-short-patch-repair endonuclease